jgi:hypothetical protein
VWSGSAPVFTDARASTSSCPTNPSPTGGTVHPLYHAGVRHLLAAADRGWEWTSAQCMSDAGNSCAACPPGATLATRFLLRHRGCMSPRPYPSTYGRPHSLYPALGCYSTFNSPPRWRGQCARHCCLPRVDRPFTRRQGCLAARMAAQSNCTPNGTQAECPERIHSHAGVVRGCRHSSAVHCKPGGSLDNPRRHTPGIRYNMMGRLQRVLPMAIRVLETCKTNPQLPPLFIEQ